MPEHILYDEIGLHMHHGMPRAVAQHRSAPKCTKKEEYGVWLTARGEERHNQMHSDFILFKSLSFK